MNTKKILSAVAAVALVSTGLLAFETNTAGEIKDGTYVGGTPATSDLNLSTNQKGDALIFPYFKDNDGWKSQMVIRNTSPYATIAKVSLYDHKNSEDIGDFNIYLSPYDVFRFTIDDGKVLTADGSIPTQVLSPRHGPKADKATFLDLDGNSELLEVLETDSANPDRHEGYVIVYGMAQYHLPTEVDIHVDRAASAYGQALDTLPYHRKHEELWKDYRRLLDDCRAGWRSAFIGAGMKDGVMRVKDVPAPDTNIGATCAITSKSVLGDGAEYQLENFGDVHTDTFIGTVRVYKEQGVQSRDLLLPATALANFSENNMYLWAEGEYAALHDRRIEMNAAGTLSWYPETMRDDSTTFLTKSAYYTFDAKGGDNATGVANQILVTQPTKKIMVQRFGTDNTSGTVGEFWLKSNSPSGGFALDYYLIDEDENSDIVEPPLQRITSPHSGAADELFNNELQVIKSDNLEDVIEYQDVFTNNDGYSYLNFVGGDNRGLPAIVTEMVGTKIGEYAQTNWLYTPTIKIK